MKSITIARYDVVRIKAEWSVYYDMIGIVVGLGVGQNSLGKVDLCTVKIKSPEVSGLVSYAASDLERQDFVWFNFKQEYSSDGQAMAARYTSS